MNLAVLEESLSILGLSEHEKSVYIKALTLEKPTVTALSLETGLERATIYRILDKLEKLKLILPKKEKFDRLVQVESPESILKLLKSRQSLLHQQEVVLKDHLPELVMNYRHSTTQPRAQYFIGKEQFILLLEQTLQETKDEMLYFGHVANLVDLVSNEYDQDYGRRRRRKKIRLRILAPSSQFTREYIVKEKEEKTLRETLFLPVEFVGLPAFQIFNNKVILWNPSIPSALLVEDSEYVKLFKNIFESFWKQAKV